MKTKMILRFSLLTGFITILLWSTSCATRKKIVYFQGEEPISDTSVVSFTLKYEIGDIISVSVSAPDPELVVPFNDRKVETQGNNQYTNYQNGAASTYGYLIQNDGTISMPIIGKIKVAGLQNSEVIAVVESTLKEYIQDPSVSIKLLNFKVTVLGEVKNPGTFAIPNERCTLLEAIGIAKDLNINGIRDNILVIRSENGTKTEHRIDLTSKDIFSSPVYYLKQNDIVYVEPNRSARFGATSAKSMTGVWVSIASMVVSTILIVIF